MVTAQAFCLCVDYEGDGKMMLMCARQDFVDDEQKLV